MHDCLKMLAVLGMAFVLSACDDESDPMTDGAVPAGDGAPAAHCDGTDDGFCPCDSAENDGRRYLFCPDVVTWEQARDKCRGFGYELARIESAAEQEFVWDFAAETEGDYWIGLSDRETEGTFVWSDGSELGDFAHWAAEQPDAGDDLVDEDCVEVIQGEDGRWNDRDCEVDYLDYICEGAA